MLTEVRWGNLFTIFDDKEDGETTLRCLSELRAVRYWLLVLLYSNSQYASGLTFTEPVLCTLCYSAARVSRENAVGGWPQGEQVVPEIRPVNGIFIDRWCGSQCRRDWTYVTAHISQKWSGHKVWYTARTPAVLPNGRRSFCSVPYDRPTASSKASFTQNANLCVLFRFSVTSFSLR